MYLARHGRTGLNAAGALRGHIDVPLDSVGHAQARSLGAALAGTTPRMIVSSPLSRALQTVQPLADLVGLEISTDARLIDRDYGEWAGVSTQAVIERWGSLDAAPGVEPVTAVRDRVLAALADIAARALGAAAVVVSHDVVIRTALAALDPGLGDPTSVPQETGCFNTLEYQRTASTVVRWAVLNVNQVPSPAW